MRTLVVLLLFLREAYSLQPNRLLNRNRFCYSKHATASSSVISISSLKESLCTEIAKAPKNGVLATPSQRDAVEKVVKQLEKRNPTTQPAYSKKMTGFWRLLYSDFDPPQAVRLFDHGTIYVF
jgi:hypothetical protein